MHIFPDIKLKFLKLIEYNNRNIFAEKSYTKCGGETITRSISIKSKFSMSLDQNVFIESQVEGYRNILKLTPQYTKQRDKFLTEHLTLPVFFCFQQSNSCSQVRMYYLEHLIPRKKHNSEDIFHRTTSSGCFHFNEIAEM